MKSFSEFLEGMTDEALGKHMRSRFERLTDAAAQGLCAHPAIGYNLDNRALRARDAQLGAQDPDDTEDSDDPLANAVTHGGTAGPREGAELVAATDSAQRMRLREMGLSERRIREILTPSPVSDADRERTAALIPGIDRLARR